jgi:transposase
MAYDQQTRHARKHHADLPPSRAPELNPVENVWQYLRQNWLSNTVFENYDAIVDAACAAWRKLIAQPQTITSIGMRAWAHRSVAMTLGIR